MSEKTINSPQTNWLQDSTFSLFLQLGPFLGRERKKQLAVLLLLMLLSSFAEVLSIGALLPFLGILTSPATVFQSKYLQPLIQLMGITTAHQLLIFLCLVFAGAIVFANLLRFITLWLGTRLSFAIGFDLSLTVYRGLLYQSYSFHVARNSSELVSLINSAGELINRVILPALNFISSSFMMVFILTALLVINWLASAIIFGGIGVLYIVMVYLTNQRLNKNGQKIAIESIVIAKTLTEGLGGIRDVLLDGTQEIYSNVHIDADRKLRRASGNNLIIATAPHYGIEAFGILIIIGVAYLLALEPKGLLSAIPVLGAIALGAQRLMPVLQKMYSTWSEMQGNRDSFRRVVQLLYQLKPPLPSRLQRSSIPFKDRIELANIAFRYGPELPWVIKNINLTLHKGVCYGLIGKTGSGKSTLIDLVMCLLEPTKGTIAIDDKIISSENASSWQAHIAHVPQSIFMSDTSILENIALGIPLGLIDQQRVDLAVKRAGLANFVEDLPEGIHTIIGEHGVRMSGGQRQRIGIARALYKDADVIIFDEATSALDSQTEEEVMNSIYSLGGENDKKYTIILIAHRLSTLKKCHQIIEVGSGEITRIGTYQEIIG